MTVRPRILVSRCLGFAAVRYDGRMLEGGFVDRLRRHVEFVPVCPEVGIGLGVPRDPVRLVRDDRGTRLYQPSTGRDLTQRMKAYAGRTLGRNGLPERLDGAVLKSRSPSCGLGDAKIYDGPGEAEHRGRESGLFAAAFRSRLPWVAVSDEAALEEEDHRSRFLVHVWILATLGSLASGDGTAALRRFHESHRPLIRAVGAGAALGEIIGRERAVEQCVEAYRRILGTALARSEPGPILEHASVVLPSSLRAGGSRK